jgi:hypothetical protein
MLTLVRHHIYRESATTIGHKSFKLYGCLHHNIRLDAQNPFLYTILVIIRKQPSSIVGHADACSLSHFRESATSLAHKNCRQRLDQKTTLINCGPC